MIYLETTIEVTNKRNEELLGFEEVMYVDLVVDFDMICAVRQVIDNDDNHIYCGSDISTGSETLFIRASPTTVNYNINITNRTGEGVGSYSNASISINYRATENGQVMKSQRALTAYKCRRLQAASSWAVHWRARAFCRQRGRSPRSN